MFTPCDIHQTVQRLKFLKRRSNWDFFENVWVAFSLNLGFSDNSDDSGGLCNVV